MREMILGKATGNLIEPVGLRPVIDDILQKSEGRQSRVVCGGRDMINEALLRAGYEPRFVNKKRVYKTPNERLIGCEALESSADYANSRIDCCDLVFEPSVLYSRSGDLFVHVDGDEYLLLLLELGGFRRKPVKFVRTICYTLKGREEEKVEFFCGRGHPEIEVVGF